MNVSENRVEGMEHMNIFVRLPSALFFLSRPFPSSFSPFCTLNHYSFKVHSCAMTLPLRPSDIFTIHIRPRLSVVGVYHAAIRLRVALRPFLWSHRTLAATSFHLVADSGRHPTSADSNSR